MMIAGYEACEKKFRDIKFINNGVIHLGLKGGYQCQLSQKLKWKTSEFF